MANRQHLDIKKLIIDNSLLVLKIIVILYIVIINFVQHNFLTSFMNLPLVKICFLGLITIASLHDLTLSLLLTVALIITIIIEESEIITLAKKVVNDQVKKETAAATVAKVDSVSKTPEPVKTKGTPPTDVPQEQYPDIKKINLKEKFTTLNGNSAKLPNLTQDSPNTFEFKDDSLFDNSIRKGLYNLPSNDSLNAIQEGTYMFPSKQLELDNYSPVEQSFVVKTPDIGGKFITP